MEHTKENLKTMSVEYLTALKQELEDIGTKRLLALDAIESDNKNVMNCIRNLKYVSKEVKQAQKIEREKAQ